MDPYFSVRQDGTFTVVEFKTESLMNPLELERIGNGLFRLVDEDQKRSIVLDFSPVKYLSSQAIGIVLTLNKKLAQHKGSKFVLCGVGPQLLQLLKITRLDRLLTIKKDQNDAMDR